MTITSLINTRDLSVINKFMLGMNYNWADTTKWNSCLVQPTSPLRLHYKTINSITILCITVQTESEGKMWQRRCHSNTPFAKTERTVFVLKSSQQPEVTRATEGGEKRCKQMAADHMLFL